MLHSIGIKYHLITGICKKWMREYYTSGAGILFVWDFPLPVCIWFIWDLPFAPGLWLITGLPFGAGIWLIRDFPFAAGT